MTNPTNLIPNFSWRFALALLPFLLVANCSEPDHLFPRFKALDTHWSIGASR